MNINPVAFSIFNIDIMWYGILIASGVLIGTLLALRESRRIGFRDEDLMDLLIVAIPSAIIGARLYYVIFQFDYYKNNLSEIINIRGGGLAIHGGIIAAVIVGAVFCKIRKVNFWQIADITAPSIILGQAIGRWGNFINQEAYGTVTDLPWGIIVDGQKVHPTFLYESLWNIVVFVFLLWYRRKGRKKDGEVFLLYAILYSVVRFFVEGLRTDSLMFGGFRVAQLISIAIIITMTGIFIKRRK
ncbi:MAG: prolipoprotein diacylglyceryl transferase [Bacillota bacterium]|nr:prolipoprotein diacylglyceryl transferase [Bacillota bacterium]